jgi:ubiquinone/menaquinone biosynthesis C-methylase UbiE
MPQSYNATSFEKTHVHCVYEAIAESFDTTRFAHWNAVKTFIRSLPPRAIVVDNGCGNGKYLGFSGRPDVHWMGNDLCSGLLACCHKNVATGGNTDLLQANGLSLPYRCASVDAVISVAVLHHLSTPLRRRAFVDEMARIVRPGGRVFVTVWATEATSSPRTKTKDWRVQDNGDAMIPWKHSDGTVVQWRYYHLFQKEELRTLFDDALWCDQYIQYELDNWTMVATRI